MAFNRLIPSCELTVQGTTCNFFQQRIQFVAVLGSAVHGRSESRWQSVQHYQQEDDRADTSSKPNCDCSQDHVNDIGRSTAASESFITQPTGEQGFGNAGPFL